MPNVPCCYFESCNMQLSKKKLQCVLCHLCRIQHWIWLLMTGAILQRTADCRVCGTTAQWNIFSGNWLCQVDASDMDVEIDAEVLTVLASWLVLHIVPSMPARKQMSKWTRCRPCLRMQYTSYVTWVCFFICLCQCDWMWTHVLSGQTGYIIFIDWTITWNQGTACYMPNESVEMQFNV